MKSKGGLLLITVFVLCLSGISRAQGDSQEPTKEPSVIDLLRQLEKKTADFKSMQTEFIQEKELAAFKNKIIIKGRIYLLKPAKIAWHVDEPLKYSVIITDKVIKQWDADTDQVQEIPFSKNPVLKTMFDYLNGWFEGNYSAFLKDYDVQLLERNPPLLEFMPKTETVVKKTVKSISLRFQEDERYLKWIKIQDISGDNTTISLINTQFNVPIGDAVWQCRR